MILSVALFFLFGLSGAYAAIGPSTSLELINKKISPDGFERSAVLAGGKFPGPLIKGNKGDRFRINVQDKLTDTTMLTDTSIHWHGFFQKGTNWADGPAWVTQCPITPGHSFLYDFDVPDQAGTFWYHSHLSTQYCDGLRGPMVVYDPHDPAKHLYDVDDESTVITLADWYHYPAPQQPKNLPAMANSTLINGLGRYLNGSLSDLAVINVAHGKRYRFRLVSISCDPNFIFSIDGHSMTIIDRTTFDWQLNGTTFISPVPMPVLLQILSGKHTPQELLPKNNLYPLKPNQVVEISIPGGAPGAPHPFHLHGHNFYVVRSAGNATYNWENPVIRDVVSTGSSPDDLTTFRFVTDNAGPWFLHCHIDWHLDSGLAAVFAEDIPTMAHENPPLAWDQLCPIYNHTHN